VCSEEPDPLDNITIPLLKKTLRIFITLLLKRVTKEKFEKVVSACPVLLVGEGWEEEGLKLMKPKQRHASC